MAIVFFVLVLLLPNPSTASDYISYNQSISGDQNLISKNGDFELGFFKPGNSPYYYIGIWYSLQKVKSFSLVYKCHQHIFYHNHSCYTFRQWKPCFERWVKRSNEATGLDRKCYRCITGFEPTSIDEWLQSDYSHGCKRKSQLQCGFNRSHLEEDGYLLMDGIRLPDNPLRLIVDDISDCKNYCLSNCSCNAYDTSENSSCSFWIGDLLNLQDQYASNMSGSGNFFLRLAASDLADPNTKKSKKATVIIIVCIAGGMLVLACVVCFLWKMKKIIRRIKIKVTLEAASSRFNENSSNGQREDNIELALFEVSTIVTATNYFSAANKLGVGGFGPVYKGILGPDQEIAVKRLSKTSTQGVEEFKNEVKLIAKLQHRNLVRLLGCCIHGEERMLIYEYMPNKSLDAFLFEKKGALLDWKTRYQIITGITRGLVYLHHDSRLRVIHRDLKVSNILLDKNMNPKISDFGLARILTGDETTDLNTRKVVGTYGYMSPEYAMEGIFSVKSDVFSFGVLLLEIISGRKNRGKYTHSTHLNLVAHAWSLWNEGNSLHLVDEALNNSYSEVDVMKCIKVGLLCVQEHAADRPLMSSVIEFLANASDIASIPMPKRPGFISRTIPIETTDLNSEIHEECTSNDLSVSLEGR